MQNKHTLIATAIAVSAIFFWAAIIFSAPTSSVLVIAAFGALVGGLIGLQAINFVPFDFKRLRGNAPRPALPPVYDDTIAKGNGSNLSRTPLAKVFAILMGVGIVCLFVATYSAITTPHPSPSIYGSTAPAP